MLEGDLKIDGHSLPRIMLGTSPFIGASQFGHRARLYQLDLYNHPDNILKIIEKSYEVGVRGIQLIPYPPVVEALNKALDNGLELKIVGTIRPEKEEEDIQLLSELNSSAMLLHAMITDKSHWDFIEKNLQAIKDTGAISGLVTHLPFRTTERLLISPINELYDIYMVPVNRLGYLMDSEFFGPEERSQLGYMLKKLDKKIIAKKVLAAGILKPEEAFDYLQTLDYVNMVAIGIASEDEAEESFRLLFSK